MTRQQWAIVVVGALLLWGAFLVLVPFLDAILWAAILALVSWPVYERLLGSSGKRGVGSSLAMTALVSLAVILPVVLIAASLAQDALVTYRSIQTGGVFSLASLKADDGVFARTLGQIPLVGTSLRQWLAQIDLVQLQEGLKGGAGRLLTFLATAGRTVSSAIVTLALVIFTVFFFYLSGPELLRQLRAALDRLGGPQLVALLEPLATTVRSVVLGLILTGVAQGVLAGIGLWAAGIQAALILGVLAALLSILQIPTPLVWFPCVVWLGANGQIWQGVALFAWGALIVGTIDNVLKPVFISQGTGIPFLLVFFGVLGGLLAFGTIGIVLGPAILSLLLVLWRSWIAPTEAIASKES